MYIFNDEDNIKYLRNFRQNQKKSIKSESDPKLTC